MLYVEKNPSKKIKQDYVASLLDYAKITFAFTARENFLSFYLGLLFISESQLMGPVITNNILACIVGYSVRVLLRSRLSMQVKWIKVCLGITYPALWEDLT